MSEANQETLGLVSTAFNVRCAVGERGLVSAMINGNLSMTYK